METKVNFVIVGVFVLVLTTALIGGVLYLTSGKYYRKSYDLYQTYMTESVAGLNLNAPVKYRGVDIGRVRRIALAPGNVEQVQLTFDVERGTPIKEDTVAVLQSQGLTGIAYVELTGGRRDSPPLRAKPGEPYPVIASGPSLLNRLETSTLSLLGSVNRTSDNLGTLLDEENRRAIRRTLADLETVTHALAARSATIDATLRDAARTMQNTARLSEGLPRLVARVERSAAALERMADQVGGAGANASEMIAATRGDVQRFTSETLPDVRQLVAELRDLTASLQRVSGELERSPSALLLGRSPGRPGPGE
jgi:phospholipid/cholesterol/gamma-HCH transport system substrate-binding protein